MDMARSRPDVFGDAGEKGDHVVVGDFLNFVDTLYAELCPLADRGEVFGGNFSRLTSENFNVQPDTELIFIGPNLAHRFAAVSSNHGAARLPKRRAIVNAAR